MTIERRVRIIRDNDAESPREWDNAGRMLCWHSRYNLGDDHSYDSDDWKKELACEADDDLEEWIDWMECAGYEWLFDNNREIKGMNRDDAHEDASRRIDEAIAERVDRAFDAGYVALLLSLYDHSGISMSAGPPSCPWDSGYVGIIICDNETVEREFGGDRDRAEKCLRAEVETYDQYLTGDVWGFVAEYRESDACECCDREHDWEHEDSCWGFFGHDPQTNGIADHVSDDYADALADAEHEYA